MKNLFVRTTIAALTALALVAGSSTAFAQGWGTLQGQFVLDGDVPTPTPIQVSKDPQFCGKHKLVDEEVVVDPETKGIANVVTFLYLSTAEKSKLQIHPDLQKLAGEKVKVDNANCRFEPHIAAIWTKQTVELANSDPVGHNMNIVGFKNAPINQLIPAGKSLEHQFQAEESLPIPVACNIHPWMKGYLVIRDNPYVAVSEKTGKFTIDKLPAGKWKFRVWQEKGGYVQNVVVDGKPENWRRGEVEVEIQDGQTTDLGVIHVPAATLKL
jgi:plastocyanin